MRINFSNATHDEIQVGIQRLGEAIAEKLARQIA
jgi:DNA-binding transcriptional MocR family regulator